MLKRKVFGSLYVHAGHSLAAPSLRRRRACADFNFANGGRSALSNSTPFPCKILFPHPRRTSYKGSSIAGALTAPVLRLRSQLRRCCFDFLFASGSRRRLSRGFFGAKRLSLQRPVAEICAVKVSRVRRRDCTFYYFCFF